MPLLMTKKVDRQLLYLNEGAYAIYIESSDKKGGDPWIRWARNFERCLPLTLWSHFGTSLSHETWQRDGQRATDELVSIANTVRQGRVVLFSGDDYTKAIEAVQDTSPKLYDRISQSIQELSRL